MSESLTPKNNPIPKQEGINTEQLTAENKETLTESVKRQVAEALEKIRSRVKAYLEYGKIKELAKEGWNNSFQKILEMIEDYPEDIKARFLNSYAGEIVSRFKNLASFVSDYSIQSKLQSSLIENFHLLNEENKSALVSRAESILPNIYLGNREIFGFIVKDEEGKDKIKDKEKERVSRKLMEVIKSRDIKTLIRNLDLLEMVGFSTEAINLIMKSDEAVIQEELKTCPEHIRKLYEERFEKRYIKREYLEKAITGARGKLETTQTEEERKKYEQVIEGLEYLRDWEKNTREHCKRMEEKYGVMEESLVNHMLERMNAVMFSDILDYFTKFADKEGLDLIEYIALLQKKYCEVIQNEMELYSWKPELSVWVIFGENDHKRKRFWSCREEGDTRGSNDRWNNTSRDINDRASLGEIYGGKLLGSNYATHGVLQTKELVNIYEFTNIIDAHYGGIMYHLIRDKVAERSTFSLYDSDPNISLVAIPHIYGFISAFYNSINYSQNYLRDGELVMDRETFVRNIPKMGIYNYWEVQFHGETGYADQISEIIYHPQTYSNKQVMEFSRIVEKYNARHPENPVTLITFEEYHRREKEKLQK